MLSSVWLTPGLQRPQRLPLARGPAEPLRLGEKGVALSCKLGPDLISATRDTVALPSLAPCSYPGMKTFASGANSTCDLCKVLGTEPGV